MRATNLRLEAAPLSPAFRGTPSAFFAELLRLTRIVSPDGYYGIVVSDVEPESNQGLWLKNGTKLYVWSDDEAAYIPADITDGIQTYLDQISDLVSKSAAGRIVFSVLEPGVNDRSKVLWAQISESNAVLAMKVWDPAALVWRLLPGTVQFALSSTGATDNQYKITLDSPASSGQLIGIPIIVRWHRTSTGPVTVVVNGLPTEYDLTDSPSGIQVDDGGIREGQVSVITFDGAEMQLVTPLAGGASHGVQLITTVGEGTFTVPTGVYSVKATVVGGGGGGGFGGTRAGGGGGGMSVKIWSVTPGQEIAYKVGAAGLAESAFDTGDATDGQDSRFNSTQIGRGGNDGGAAGLGVGGAHAGGDYGIDGAPGTFNYESDKRKGGPSAFPGSVGGYPGVPGRLGGGGGGDLDSVGNDSSDGGAGAILLEW